MRVTKTLLACGVVAGPLYVLVSLTEALTRDGFDLVRHQWSLLSDGDLGWIHITNLVVTGLMTIAFAVGLRRALRPGRGATWAARLVGVYGASLVGAGVFRADPALGFPRELRKAWHGSVGTASCTSSRAASGSSAWSRRASWSRAGSRPRDAGDG